jgi:hypothetical protein
MEVPWTRVTKIMDTSPLSPHGFTICGLWFTTSRPTSGFAKRTLFRAYGRMIAPSCQNFFAWGTAGKTLSLSTLSIGFVTSCTCQTYPNVMAQHWTNLQSRIIWNSLLGMCSHERNQRQQILGYGKMRCGAYTLGQQCFQPD